MGDAIIKQIAQLEAARRHVLSDAVHYSVIIPGILPIIGPNAHLDIRRWGTEFLAEGFASPQLALHAKEALSVQVLQLLRDLLENPTEDEYVVKNVIQTAASIYGLIFRHITNNPQNAQTWAQMAAVKSNILKRFDTSTITVRLCCIKFVQRVVLVQTPGVISDPRRPELNDISLALVPRDHPVIPPPHLEAEASGLLDRLLNVFYEEKSDALLVDATLNCLSLLVRSRQTIANKIISVILSFNPLKQAHDGMSSKEKVLIKSMERTSRAFLMNIYRRNENGPFAGRIRQHVDRMMSARLEAFEETHKKRGPPEPTDGLDNAKRARLAADLNDPSSAPPLPAGPVSIAQLFTLTRDESLRSFDVTSIPLDLVVKIAMSVFSRVDASHLDAVLNTLRSRYLDISRQPPVPGPPLIPVDAAFEDEEDDYEPEFEPQEPHEDDEQRGNYTPTPPAEEEKPEADLALKVFRLPAPPPITFDEAESLGNSAVSRVFGTMNYLDEPSKVSKAGLIRFAGSSFDREAWITVMTRLATRAPPNNVAADDIDDQDKAALVRAQEYSLGDGIRNTLWKYVVEDFRHRIDVAISWLNEEWYNDRVANLSKATETKPVNGESTSILRANYEKWVLKLLDAIIPYLDANDKVLVRFLGEIPEVSQAVLERVKNMARDPDRVTLAVKAIYYLVAFKPPAKEMAINALEDLWNNYEEAKSSVRPLLARIRPAALADTGPQATIKKESSATPVPHPPTPALPAASPPPAPANAEPSPKPVVAAV